MGEYTGFKDKNGTKINKYDTVKGWGNEYEICWSNWADSWVIDGIKGTGKLEKCHDEIEKIN